MIRLYKTLVISLIFLQLAWFFMPWGFAYDEHSINAFYWLGYGSFFETETITTMNYFVLTSYTLSCIGLLFFNIWARRAYMLVVILGGLIVPMYGMSVQSGYEDTMAYFMTLGDGIIICLSYFTNLNLRFLNIADTE